MKYFNKSLLLSSLMSMGIVAHAATPAKANAIPTVADALNQAVTQHHVDTGVAVQVLKPFFQNNPAYYQVTFTRDATSSAVFTVNDVQKQVDVNSTVDAAPEVWLGYVSDNGLGVRTRFWYFREGTSQSVAPPAKFVDGTFISGSAASSAAPIGLDIDTRDNNLPDFMSISTTLKTLVWDGLVTQDFNAFKTDMQLGGGIRYVYLYQLYNAFEHQDPGQTIDIRDPDNPVQQYITQHEKRLSSNQKFNGGGPVIQFQAKHTFGESGFSLIGLVRNSVLFGPAKQNASKTLLVRGTQNNGTTELNENAYVGRSNHRNSVLDILETELGIEYGRMVSPLSRWYGKLTFNVQEWFGGGSASRSSTTGTGFGLPGSGQTGAPQVAGATSDSNFGFIGGSLKFGYEFS